VAGQDWPQFLGPLRNGISDETGLLDRWPTNGVPVVWQKKIGPATARRRARRRLVLHHRAATRDRRVFRRHQPAKTLWRYGYPSQFVDPYGYNNGRAPLPCLTADRCYTFGAEANCSASICPAADWPGNATRRRIVEVPPRVFRRRQLAILEG